MAWNGFTLLTKKIESCLGGTVAKAPFAAFNALVEIGTVCHVDAFDDFYTQQLHSQAVADNNDTMKASIERLDERAKDIADALSQAETEAACIRVDKFFWYILQYNAPLSSQL